MRALKVMVQIHIHIEQGKSVLSNAPFVFDLYGMTYCPDAHLVYRKLMNVGLVLHIFNRKVYW